MAKGLSENDARCLAENDMRFGALTADLVALSGAPPKNVPRILRCAREIMWCGRQRALIPLES